MQETLQVQEKFGKLCQLLRVTYWSHDKIGAEITEHTIYPGNNICQKCGGKTGLWVLHEMINKTYAENMKKIVGAVWELPAK